MKAVREVEDDDDDDEEYWAGQAGDDDEEYLAGGGDPEIYEDNHDGYATTNESESESIESDDYDENVDYAELVNTLENDRDRLRQHNTDQMVEMYLKHQETIIQREKTREREDEASNKFLTKITDRMQKQEADAKKKVDKAKVKQAKQERRLLDRGSKNQSRATATGTKTPSNTSTKARAQNNRSSKIVLVKVSRAATKKKETTEQTPTKPAARIGSLQYEQTSKVQNTRKAPPKTAPSKATTKRALKPASKSLTNAGTKSGLDRSNAGPSAAIFDDDASFCGDSVSTLGSNGSACSTGTRSSLRDRPGRPKNDDDYEEEYEV